MTDDFQRAAGSLFGGKDAARISDKKDEIEKLAGSSDGQAIKAMLDRSGTDLQSAVKNGDMDTLRGAVSDIMKTAAGARLFKQLSDMMK